MAERDWASTWGSCTPEELDAIALLRVVECSNGCIQHAFRDNSVAALPIEQTRAAMNFSMAAMKNLVIEIGEDVIRFEGELAEALREARELYIRAFKRGDEEAMSEFFACSEASVRAVGEDRLHQAADRLRTELSHVFPGTTPDWGLQYLRRFLA